MPGLQQSERQIHKFEAILKPGCDQERMVNQKIYLRVRES